jgi:tetratricopeptide (TPR) repeat protein
MGVPFLVALFLQAAGWCNSGDSGNVREAARSALPAVERRQAYERLIQNCPNEPKLYVEYAALLIAARSYSAALDWISKGLAIAPGNDDLRLKQAIALRAAGDPEGSLKILVQLPPSAESCFYAGLDYRVLGNHEAARQSLSAAWDMGFQDPYVLYALIDEEHALGDKAAGMKHFQLFIDRFPESPWLHVLLGNVYMQKNKNDEARQEYLEALRRDPELPSVNFLVGYLSYQGEQYGTAADYFRKEIAVNPGYADASLFLGESLRQLGRAEDAVAPLRQALALNPRSALAYKTLGTVLTETGRLEEAAGILEKGEQSFPSDTTFPAQLSRLFARLNRKDDARREAERYRSMMGSKESGPPAVDKR